MGWLNLRQLYHTQRVTFLFMNRAVHNLCEIHKSTYSLKKPERQKDTVSSPPRVSVFIISLLQQVLTAFVALLIVGHPSTATTKQKTVLTAKQLHMWFFPNKRGREHFKNTKMSNTDSAKKATLVWNHNRRPWSVLCWSKSHHVILSPKPAYLYNASPCSSSQSAILPTLMFGSTENYYYSSSTEASTHLAAKML